MLSLLQGCFVEVWWFSRGHNWEVEVRWGEGCGLRVAPQPASQSMWRP